MAPPRKSGSKPGRALAALVALIVVMLIGIVGANAFSPGKWQHDFKIGLGLDLSSGTEATLAAVTAKGQTPPAADMQQAVSIITSRVNASGSTGVSVQREGANDITVTVPGKGSQQVVNEVSTTAQLRFRPVLLAGSSTPATSATPTPSPSATGSKATPGATASPAASTKAFIRHAAATPTPAAKASGGASATPTASASATPSPAATSSAATATAGNASAVSPAVLKLFDKLDCSSPSTWKTKLGYTEPQWDAPASQTVACGPSGMKYVLGQAVILGTDVTSESAAIDTTTNGWVVNLTLNGKATKAFGNLTATQASKYYPSVNSNADDSVLDQTAIVLDGNVVEAPQTTQAIPAGNVQITNIGGQTQANQLVDELKYGALPLSFQVKNTTTVTAQLGRNQLDAGLIAGAIGLALVVLYSFLYYRGLGIVSVSSLLIAALIGYLAIVLLSKYQSFTLSLAGIAGLIVAIGITADSFVVFFERLRDEVREGKSLRGAVESGWKRARRTILVSDTVSFLAALLLYIFSVGDVKGFAYTLGLTTLIDVVVVFLFTKPMVTLLARTRFYGQGHKWSGLDPARLGAPGPVALLGAPPQRAAGRTRRRADAADDLKGGMMSRLGDVGGRLYRGDVSVNFVGRQKLWYTISGCILVIAVVALLVRGLNFSVEFKGGSVFQVKAPTASIGQVEKAVTDGGGGNAVVQQVGVGSKAQWQAQTAPLTIAQTEHVQNSIAKELGVNVNSINTEFVGPTWGSQISSKALEALIAFLIVIVIYLSIAFEWKMAVAAFIALLHDILITVGVYALAGFQVSPATVIGLLTILGYSLYDTVVVFDKVRENTAGLVTGARSTYSQAANLALNQTLVRSINTSIIALLPVAAILIAGVLLLGTGELSDLALVLFIGMLSGTYSSICIATPVLADLKEREPQYQALAKRLAARAASPRVAAKQVGARAQAGVPAGGSSAAAVSTGDAAAGTPGDQPAASRTDDAADPYDGTTGPGDDAAAAPKSPVGAGRAAPGSRPAAPGSRQQPRRTSAAKRRPNNAKKKRR